MSGTGIAGAQEYKPRGGGNDITCCACGVVMDGNTKGSPSARAIPGRGIIHACSQACAEAPEFKDAASAEVLALRAVVTEFLAAEDAVEAEARRAEQPGAPAWSSEPTSRRIHAVTALRAALAAPR